MKGTGQKTNTKRVVLLAHENEVKDYLKRRRTKRDSIIALSPFAMYALDKNGVSYHLPEDYYDLRELYRVGVKNYSKVEKICNYIDEKIQKFCSAIKNYDIKPCFFNYYHIKMLYDAVTSRVFQLFKIIESERPDKICVYRTEKFPFLTSVAPYIRFDYRESIYARLLECEKWKIAIEMFPSVPYPELPRATTNLRTKIERKIISLFLQSPELLDFLAMLYEEGSLKNLEILIRYLPFMKKQKCMLIGGEAYNWQSLRAYLVKHLNISPIFVRFHDDPQYWLQLSTALESEYGHALHQCWLELRRDPVLRKFFIWKKVDFFPLFEDRVQFLVEKLSLACLSVYTQVKEWIRKNKIRILFTHSLYTNLRKAAAKAAKDSGIPVFLWQHGAYGYLEQLMVPYNDFLGPDIVFVFGSGVVKKYKKNAKHYGVKLLPVGSPSLEKCLKAPNTKKIQSSMSKKILLYVTTNYYQNSFYVYSPPTFSDNYFWLTQRSILEALAKHQQHSVLIKLHPSIRSRLPPLIKYATEKKIKNCKFIVDEYKFVDLLPLADLIVIDFPTTTLLEALTTSKPVFVYGGHLHIDETAKKVLKKRVFYFDELNELIKALDNFVKTWHIDETIDLDNKEFLKLYGTDPESNVTEKASKILKDFLSMDR